MPDSYLSIASIANDEFITERMNSAVSQQQHLGNFDTGTRNVEFPYSAQAWVKDYRYIWASSPGWGEKWTYSLETHPDDPNYEPGKDEGVITDGDILATVQALGS